MDDRVTESRDSRTTSSHGLSLEPTPARSADLGKHSGCTHFPKDRNCGTKIASCGRLWPIQLWPIHFGPISVVSGCGWANFGQSNFGQSIFALLCCWLCVGGCWWLLVWTLLTPLRRTPPPPCSPPPDRPKFRSFFSLSRHHFRSFRVSLGVFSLN